MYIYKFTHISTGKCYIGQTIQDPNRRRLAHKIRMQEIANQKKLKGTT